MSSHGVLQPEPVQAPNYFAATQPSWVDPMRASYPIAVSKPSFSEILNTCGSEHVREDKCLDAFSRGAPHGSHWLHNVSSKDLSFDMPQQLHLSLGAEEQTMTITWLTNKQCPESFVSYGDSADRLHRRSAASSSTYSVPERWWQPKTMRWIHTAHIGPFKPSQTFYYRVGDERSRGCSTTREPIEAMAPLARGHFPVRAALMADVGQTFGELGFATWKHLDELTDPKLTSNPLPADFAVHAGDISYAGMHVAIPKLDLKNTDEWEPLWDIYGHAHEPFTRRRAYMLTVGNHEAWYDWAATKHRYPMQQSRLAEPSPSAVSAAAEHVRARGTAADTPHSAAGRAAARSGEDSEATTRYAAATSLIAQGASPLPKAEPPFWFSFETGGVHWVMLSSEHELAPSSPQHTWACAALTNINRTRTPWSIVSFHRPMYCSEKVAYAQQCPGAKMQRDLEGLLLEHNVDLVVTGHQHVYERVHPNVNGKVVSSPVQLSAERNEDAYLAPKAPVYLVVGHGGAEQWEEWVTPAPEWSARRVSNGCDFTGGAKKCGPRWKYTDTFGWAHADFKNATHLRVTTQMLSGSMGDVFWLIREGGMTESHQRLRIPLPASH